MCTCSHPTPAHTYTHSRCLHTSTLIPCLGTVGCPIYPCSHGQWGLSSPTCAPAAPHCLPTNAELVRKHFSLKDKNCAKISLMIPAPHKCKHVIPKFWCTMCLTWIFHRCKTQFGPLMPRNISYWCSSNHSGKVSILYFKRIFHIISRYGT